MSSSTSTEHPLPPEAWVLGWTFFVGQALLLAHGGLSDADGPSIVLSVVLSTVIVGCFSAGVLRARPVRTVVLWILLGLSGIAWVLGAATDPGGMSGWDWIELVATLAQLAALYSFRRTAYVAEMRADRDGTLRPDITALVALAVVVGFMGGIAQADATQARAHISF